jgi:hypothetical protein
MEALLIETLFVGNLWYPMRDQAFLASNGGRTSRFDYDGHDVEALQNSKDTYSYNAS